MYKRLAYLLSLIFSMLLVLSFMTTPRAAFAAGGAITYAEAFPDSNFRKETLRILNTMDGGVRTNDSVFTDTDQSVLAEQSALYIYELGITDLTGLKYYAGLRGLYCQDNALTSLDLSGNTALKVLWCMNNRLASLDISGLKELTDLWCSGNNLTALDVTGNKALTILECYDNLMESADSARGWRELGLIINSPDRPFDGTFLFYSQRKVSVPKDPGKDSGESSSDSSSESSSESSNESSSESREPSASTAEDITVNRAPLSGPAGGVKNPFKDIAESHWYYGDVLYAYTRGLMIGTSSNPMLFNPDIPMSRGMAATALWRLAGCPEDPQAAARENVSFPDVANNAYYFKAVTWATANDIGYSYHDGLYRPDDPATREQMAAMLYNYAMYAKIELKAIRAYREFKDSARVADYAKTAARQLYMAGVISGKPGDLFDPQASATRAEVAAMLRRFSEIDKASSGAQGSQTQ